MSGAEKKIRSRDEWLFGDGGKVESKSQRVKNLIIEMLNRTLGMFEYKGLPDSLPQKDLEMLLQCGGYAIIKRVDGELYAFCGGLGGEPNVYYLPTMAVVANPALKYSKSLEIDDDCVVILNDYFYQGFLPAFEKYATLQADAEISLHFSILNSRVPVLIQADNDITKESAEEFIKQIYDGEKYGIIASNEMFDGIKTQDFLKKSSVVDSTIALQFVKGSWLNEYGVPSAFNLKHEQLNDSETELNDALFTPLADTLLACRRAGLEKVNKMFNTNITVNLTGVWKRQQEIEKAEVENMKNGENAESEVSNNDEQTENI